MDIQKRLDAYEKIRELVTQLRDSDLLIGKTLSREVLEQLDILEADDKSIRTREIRESIDRARLIKVISERVREDHRKYAHEEGVDWALISAVKVAKILEEFQIDPHNEDDLLIPIWEACHVVLCWWNETPVKGGYIDRESLKQMMISVIKARKKYLTEKNG